MSHPDTPIGDLVEGGKNQMIHKDQMWIQAESDSLYRKASEYYHKAEYEKAMSLLTQAVNITPNFSSAFCLMGHCNEKQGLDENALELYSQAIEVDPYHSKAWYYKGETLNRLGKPKEGQKFIERAIALSFGR